MARKQRIDLGNFYKAGDAEKLMAEVFSGQNGYYYAGNDLENLNRPGIWFVTSSHANVPCQCNAGILINQRYKSNSADNLLQMLIPATQHSTVINTGVRMLVRAKSLEITNNKCAWREFSSTALTTTASLLQQIQLNNDNDMKDNAIKLGGGRHSLARPYPRWLAMRRYGAERRAA